VIHQQAIAVVIPAYRVADHILDVLSLIPETVDHIIVVDDACPQGSGRKAASVPRKGLVVVYHENNKGVGGAVITGYKKALELGCGIVVKIDGDGQMDPSYIGRLVAPLARNRVHLEHDVAHLGDEPVEEQGAAGGIRDAARGPRRPPHRPPHGRGGRRLRARRAPRLRGAANTDAPCCPGSGRAARSQLQ